MRIGPTFMLRACLSLQVQPPHMDDWRGLLRGCAMLASVGAAAAILPGIIRKAVDDLANVHQVCDFGSSLCCFLGCTVPGV